MRPIPPTKHEHLRRRHLAVLEASLAAPAAFEDYLTMILLQVRLQRPFQVCAQGNFVPGPQSKAN